MRLETLTYESSDRVARITLDRPQRGNGITPRMPAEIAACVERANLDPAIHAIALAGNGSGFCASMWANGKCSISSAVARMTPVPTAAYSASARLSA